jgi:quercetin dioxygenase-like cupin family protein
MNKIATSLSIALALWLATTAVADHHEKPAGDMGLFPAAEIKWGDGPPSLQKGAAMAVLEGDPAKEGMFTMRLRFPAGFVVNPHYHSQIEHVTVISGTLQFGMGEKFDRAKTRPMPAGSFGFWPIGMRHFAYAEGETVLQLHGRGPWTITYVNPKDDPRLAGK